MKELEVLDLSHHLQLRLVGDEVLSQSLRRDVDNDECVVIQQDAHALERGIHADQTLVLDERVISEFDFVSRAYRSQFPSLLLSIVTTASLWKS